MRRLLVAATLALVPCSHAQDTPKASGDTQSVDRIASALASPERPLSHRIRDETRDPTAIVELMNLDPGDRVLDLGSGGGYLALIASAMVGEGGHVDIHNTPGWIAQFPSMDPEAMKRGISNANIGYVTTPWDEIDAPPESYDTIVMGQVYHDAVLEAADIPAMNRSLFSILKPGGVVVIEDHAADEKMPLGQQVGLHRIAASAVIDQMQVAGFVNDVARELPSAHDDLRFNVFRPGIRGRTSRYILVFSRPD